MKTPSFWTMLGTIGQISQDITEAYSDDNKIDANEIINIGLNLVKKIDLDWTMILKKMVFRGTNLNYMETFL